jgi:RNA polymerase sigma-70 factor (ECF subfamily)
VLDFQAGQPEAFVEIHRRYGPLAKHVCARFLPNRADADEAFQETMIRVFQGLHRFNGRYALQPWIARIATNVSLDQIRTRQRRPLVGDGTIEDQEPLDPADGPEEVIERLIERDLVLSVLAGLPPNHRTALVLRELEGRSHKEIALALDITPAQAKALIHRAKGTFRRNWLLAVTEKGGLAGIALLPLLWLAKAAEGARRVADRVVGHASQVAQAATPEVVASAASSPAVVASASTMTERIVAAGMTIVLAGGVTVGAATIVKERNDREPAERTQAAAAPVAAAPEVEDPAEDPAVVPPVVERDPRDAAAEQDPPVTGTTGVVADPTTDPTVDPTTEPTVEPTTEPTVDPTTDPSEEPTAPPVPPVPDWAGSFSVLWSTTDDCGCPGIELVTSRATGGLLGNDGVLSLGQRFRGGALDAEGDAAWHVDAQVIADLTATGGNGSLRLVLRSGDVETTFLGAVEAVAITGTVEAGDLVYALSGRYSALAPIESPIPTEGGFEVRIGVWTDGATVVATGIALTPDVATVPELPSLPDLLRLLP